MKLKYYNLLVMMDKYMVIILVAMFVYNRSD